jgi:phage tail-like protein
VSDETAAVQKWLNKNAWEMEVFTGSIKLMSAGALPVAEWTLRDVMPAKWSISTFDAGASQVSMETLELVHRGFLDDERKLA